MQIVENSMVFLLIKTGESNWRKVVALNLEQKKAMVSEITRIANQAVSVVAANYRGLTVSEMSELRKSAREAHVCVRVYRNTLTRRSFKKTTYACLEKVLIGPIVLFFSQEEPSVSARLIEKFIREHKHLEVKGLVLDGKFFPAEKLKVIALLPSYQEAISQLVAFLLVPLMNLIYILNEPIAQITRVMVKRAVRDQKAV